MRLINQILIACILMFSVAVLAAPTSAPTSTPSDLLKDAKLEHVGSPSSWQASPLEGATVSIEKDSSNAHHPALKITVDKVDGTDWHAQVFQSGLSVAKGAKYTLSFTAKASAPRKIAAFLQELSAPYKMLSDGKAINLTADAAPQKIEFTATDTSSDGKLTLAVGDAAGTVTLSNISLTKND